MYRLFLFDLDGTLVDTSPGILEALRQLEREMGAEPLPQKTLEKFVGPPLDWSMETYYGLDPETAREWSEVYRRIYGQEGGIENSRLYPYIKETLALIREKGGRCAVTSLKSHDMVATTLDVYDLSKEFDVLVGRSDLPPPVAQYRVHDQRGLVARVDFAWPEHRVALEYDGLWHGGRDQFFRDRERLNRLREAGWQVVFVTAVDLRDPVRLISRIAAALAVSAR